jgi:hypothetical protein
MRMKRSNVPNQMKQHNLTAHRHGEQPLSVICVHLRDADSMEWVQMGGEGSRDWLCPGCAETFARDGDIKYELLTTLCIKCVDERRWLFDSDFSQ